MVLIDTNAKTEQDDSCSAKYQKHIIINHNLFQFHLCLYLVLQLMV